MDRKLIQMANQIGRFFESQPGEAPAIQTAHHLRNFWDPKMRAALCRLLAAGEVGLSPTAAAAAALLAPMADPEAKIEDIV